MKQRLLVALVILVLVPFLFVFQVRSAPSAPAPSPAEATHKSVTSPRRPHLLAENIKRFGELGLEVQFTELDVKLQEGTGTREERLAEQARQYSDVLRSCLAQKDCTAFMTWGFTDRFTWLGSLTGQDEAPLLFDESYRPKPAYEAIKQILSSVKTVPRTQP